MQDRFIDKTVQFIDSLFDKGVRVLVGCVVTKLNMDDIENLVKYFGPRVPHYHFMSPGTTRQNATWLAPLIAPESAFRVLDGKLAALAEKYGISCQLDPATPVDLHDSGCHGCKGCAAAFTKLVIDPWMNAYPCEITPELSLGNLRDKSLLDVWQHPVASTLRSGSRIPCKNSSYLSELIQIGN